MSDHFFLLFISGAIFRLVSEISYKVIKVRKVHKVKIIYKYSPFESCKVIQSGLPLKFTNSIL